MRDNERIELDQMNDTTIAQLLTHLQHLRRTVPVNYQLKAELKAKLLQRMKEMEASRSQATLKNGYKQRRLWKMAGLVILIIAATWFVIWSKGSLHMEERSFYSVPLQNSFEAVDLSAQGDKVAFVGGDGKLNTISIDSEKEKQIYVLPKTEGTYQSLSWSGDDNQIALVEIHQNTTRLWMIDIPAQGRNSSSRLLREETGAIYHHPTWSPNNDKIAYTRVENGKEEIWVNSTVSFQERKITEGSQPEWSPTGNELAFVREGTVSILNLATGETKTAGEGSWPSWQSKDQLTYITPENKLVEIYVGEERMEAKTLSIPEDPGEKVVRANWAKNGKHLLITYQTEKMYMFSILSRN